MLRLCRAWLTSPSATVRTNQQCSHGQDCGKRQKRFWLGNFRSADTKGFAYIEVAITNQRRERWSAHVRSHFLKLVLIPTHETTRAACGNDPILNARIQPWMNYRVKRDQSSGSNRQRSGQMEGFKDTAWQTSDITHNEDIGNVRSAD